MAAAECDLSLGVSVLLLILTKRGAVAGVVSLFYLVPSAVAMMAFALFGEQLSALQVAGMAVAATSIAVASRNP